MDKPVGPTSHDVVARARRALGTRRIGHTGTLDPFASGLLLLCIGRATRVAEYLTGLSKEYLALMRLGVVTATDDGTGEVISSTEAWREVDPARLTEAFQAMTGPIDQVPPRFSAKKVGGERMYAAARRGEEFERKPVRVTVHEIEVVRVEGREVEFRVVCSSGTYIRSIARDVGEALGVGAHLSELRRTRIGDHSVEGALSLERLDDTDSVAEALMTPADALRHLPRVVVGEEEERLVGHGRPLRAPEGLSPGPHLLVGPTDRLLAIAEPDGERLLPRKVFL